MAGLLQGSRGPHRNQPGSEVAHNAPARFVAQRDNDRGSESNGR